MVDLSTTEKTITTITNYLMGVVYETRTSSPADAVNDYTNRLQFIAHEEGRIRFTPTLGATPAKLSYDYFLKDHLGNVRMVLTEETASDTYPTLSFEGNTDAINLQNAFWENKSGGSINVTSVRSLQGSDYTMLVNKQNGSIGAAKLLKVMKGDKIHTSVDYSYTVDNADNSEADGIGSLTSNIVSLIASSLVPGGVLKAGSADMVSTLTGQPSLVNILNNTPPASTGPNQTPKAFLHILLFNEQFQFDPNSSFVLPVGTSKTGTLAKMALNAVNVNKNGYAYIYFSNESKDAVHFDDFLISHDRGPILEETHYYPFGLAMSGISSRAMGKLENRFKFNDGSELQSKEFSDGSGLELYETAFRSYDPQIGRFWEIDPLAEEFDDFSPYTFANNNPILYNDPTGLASELPDKPNTDDVKPMPEVIITAKIKRLDYANGQVMAPRSEFWDLLLGKRDWNEYAVGSNGYLTGLPSMIQMTVPDISKGSGKKIIKAVDKYLVYRAIKMVNGKRLIYIGKAKNLLKKRYTQDELKENAARAIEGLNDLPDNGTALGVEQALIELNGGIHKVAGATANINNAATKKIYVEAGLKWLNQNIPEWKTLFKFE